MRVMYYEITLARSDSTAPVSSAHFFDVETKKITETAPLPVGV
jgi:hypothetical protein